MNANRKRQDKNGFTLIEIAVVVIIVMVIAAIAIPRYNMAVEKTYLTKAKKYLLDLYGAEMRYALYHSDFTTADITQLDIEETVPPEYTLLTPMAVTAAHGPTRAIANIQRNKSAPDNYILSILTTSATTCSSPGSAICRKLGY